MCDINMPKKGEKLFRAQVLDCHDASPIILNQKSSITLTDDCG